MDLQDYRKEIDKIDRAMIELFEKRMQVSEQIGLYKQERNIPVLDSGREREKLTAVSQRVSPKYKDYIVSYFSLLMQLSRARQGAILEDGQETGNMIDDALESTPKIFPDSARVACQGVLGAYSQMACDKLFSLPYITYYGTFGEVFDAIESGECDYGMIPVENSVAGSVNAVYDLMLKHNFYIVRSTRVKVNHCLVAKKGTKLTDIREIYSHPQAIMQCGAFLDSLDNVKVVPADNTAKASKMVAESGRSDVAALSSETCAELYGLECLEADVQTQGNNFTRFICISRNLEIYPGADKTSLMITVPHYKGSLYNFLSRFYALGINLTKIESRPIPNKDFEFMFYFDLDVSVYAPKLRELLDEFRNTGAEFAYLGSYSEIV